MDKEELQKNIALYYSKLPSEAQTIFASMAWLETVRTLSIKFALNEDQTETLATETSLVLLGVIHTEEYAETIKNKLGLVKETGEKLYGEVDALILGNLKPKLNEAFKQNNQTVPTEESLVSSNLDERFASLPADIKQAIDESDYQSSLYQIGQEHKLTIEQIGRLEMYTVDVMLGVTPTDKFENVLRSNLGLQDEQAGTIATQVNEKILKKIRSNMMSWTPKIDAYELPAPADHEAQVESREEMLKKIESPETVAMPILAQKLGGAFQIPATQTEHSLDNISKQVSTPKAPVAYPPKADPYRLNPEE